uniref:Uncharacterized protein n=1 Tax=Geospiza parvula TaxID=87175 RepID=A0A8C3MLU6_GEOPR
MSTDGERLLAAGIPLWSISSWAGSEPLPNSSTAAAVGDASRPPGAPERGGSAAEIAGMVVLQCIYGLVCLLGLLGNALVIFVILRYAKMKTATNIYLLNLAIADELFMLSVPFVATAAALRRWPFGRALCRTVLGVDGLNMFSSVFCLTVLSLDRYIAVVHPLRAASYRRRRVRRQAGQRRRVAAGAAGGLAHPGVRRHGGHPRRPRRGLRPAVAQPGVGGRLRGVQQRAGLRAARGGHGAVLPAAGRQDARGGAGRGLAAAAALRGQADAAGGHRGGHVRGVLAALLRGAAAGAAAARPPGRQRAQRLAAAQLLQQLRQPHPLWIALREFPQLLPRRAAPLPRRRPVLLPRRRRGRRGQRGRGGATGLLRRAPRGRQGLRVSPPALPAGPPAPPALLRARGPPPQNHPLLGGPKIGGERGCRMERARNAGCDWRVRRATLRNKKP